MAWKPVPLDSPVYTNVDETALRNGQATLENAFVTEARGHSRFPGLKEWLRLPEAGGQPVHVFDWNEDLMAVTRLGRVFRLGRDKSYADVTAVPVAGGKRPTAARTPDSIVFAAGGPIVEFAGTTTRLLSDDAPETTHVGYLDSYLIAIEPGSPRFWYSDPGEYGVWPDLNVFSAEANHDPTTALVVTDFRELLICGPKSIEQWETNTSGTAPFYRRHTAGQGVYAPYSLVTADNAVYCVSTLRELSRVSGQLVQPVSVPVQQTLEGIRDWTGAWAATVNMRGNRFIIMQAPAARTPYGTDGLTLAYDFRQQRFSFLYGWDAGLALQGRWPGWSIAEQWDRTFVGGDGVIYEMDADTYAQDGGTMLMLGRTGHWEPGGPTRIDNMRLRMRRGQAADAETFFQIRVNRDNRGWRDWRKVKIGQSGERDMTLDLGSMGCAHSFQFEYRITQPLPIEIVSIAADCAPLGW